MLQIPREQIGCEHSTGQELIDWINTSADFPLKLAHQINKACWSNANLGKFIKWHAVSNTERGLIKDFYQNPWQQPKGPLLDLACAGGHHLEYFTKKEIQPVFGIDVSEAFVKKAKKRVPGALVLQGDILDLPYRSNSFDTIVARGIFHLTTTKGLILALREAYRVLKNGGIIYINRRYKPTVGEQGKVKQVSLFTYLIFDKTIHSDQSQEPKLVRNYVPEPQLTSIIRSIGFIPFGDPPATEANFIDEKGEVRFSLSYVCTKQGNIAAGK